MVTTISPLSGETNYSFNENSAQKKGLAAMSQNMAKKLVETSLAHVAAEKNTKSVAVAINKPGERKWNA